MSREKSNENLVNTHVGEAPSVDELLDNIDLTFPGYEPSDDALHFWSVMQMIKGADFFHLGVPILHYYFIDLAFGNVKRKQFPYGEKLNNRIRIRRNKLAILCARGLSKSSTFSAFLVIYMAMFGRLPGMNRANTGDKVWFVIGIGDSQENGAKVMCNTIRDMIEESDLLQNYFEKIRCTDAEIELVRADDPQNPTSKNDRSFLFRVKGSQSGIRGQRYRGERVDVIIADDLISTEADARSKVIQKSIRGTIYSDSSSALRFTGGMQILIGTPFNKEDIIYSAIEKGWTPLVVPVCEKIYEGMPKEDWVGAWPEAHTYESVMDTYLGMKESEAEREFQQERMLRIASNEDKMIKPDYIQWYSRVSFMKNLADYNLYITTDFTASNDTSKGDYSVVVLWAISSADDWFMVDISAKRMAIEEQYDPLFRMVQTYGVMTGRNITVGVETNGQQQIHIPALRNKMRELNVHFTFARQVGKKWGSIGISRGGMNKFEHFEMVVPQFQAHKIFFPEEMKDNPDMKLLLEELNYVTYDGFTARHDDCLDCVSMVKLIDYRKPSVGGSRDNQKKVYNELVEDPMFSELVYDDIPASAGY